MTVEFRKTRSQRGVTLFGLLFWAIIIGFFALVGLRVLLDTHALLWWAGDDAQLPR